MEERENNRPLKSKVKAGKKKLREKEKKREWRFKLSVGVFFCCGQNLYVRRDCCIKANRCVAFGIRLWSHTEVFSLQTSPSAPCASSFLQSLDNLTSKIVRPLTFATVSFCLSPRGVEERFLKSEIDSKIDYGVAIAYLCFKRKTLGKEVVGPCVSTEGKDTIYSTSKSFSIVVEAGIHQSYS